MALTLDRCLPADPPEVRRAVAIELGAELADAEASDTTRANVTCSGAFVLIEVVDPITGKSLSRHVALELAPRAARSRLLALALVELITASWTELEHNPEPALPPASAPPSPEARAAALRAVQRLEIRTASETAPALAPTSAPVSMPSPAAAPFRVEALFEARGFPSQGILGSLGFGAAFSHRLRDPWGWRVDLLADHASASTNIGTVAVDTLSAGGSFYLEKAWARVALQGDAGLRVGGVSFAGSPQSNVMPPVMSSTHLSPWGGPFVRAAAHVWPTRGFAVEVGGELGEAPFAARGQVANQFISVGGVWVGGHAGGVFSF